VNRKLLFALAGLITFLAVDSAIAGKVRMGPGLARGTKNAGPTLSAADLRDCMRRQDAINAASDALGKRGASMKEASIWIDTRETELKRLKPQLDTSNREAVDDYKKRVGELKKAVEEFNAKVDPYHADAKDLDAKVDAFNDTCAVKAYYEDDMRAIAAGRVPPK